MSGPLWQLWHTSRRNDAFSTWPHDEVEGIVPTVLTPAEADRLIAAAVTKQRFSNRLELSTRYSR